MGTLTLLGIAGIYLSALAMAFCVYVERRHKGPTRGTTVTLTISLWTYLASLVCVNKADLSHTWLVITAFGTIIYLAVSIFGAISAFSRLQKRKR